MWTEVEVGEQVKCPGGGDSGIVVFSTIDMSQLSSHVLG
jgi:hypothetical protein